MSNAEKTKETGTATVEVLRLSRIQKTNAHYDEGATKAFPNLREVLEAGFQLNKVTINESELVDVGRSLLRLNQEQLTAQEWTVDVPKPDFRPQDHHALRGMVVDVPKALRIRVYGLAKADDLPLLRDWVMTEAENIRIGGTGDTFFNQSAYLNQLAADSGVRLKLPALAPFMDVKGWLAKSFCGFCSIDLAMFRAVNKVLK